MGGQNASLASIHSSSENYFIHAKVREYNIDEYYDPDVWIGMYKYTIGEYVSLTSLFKLCTCFKTHKALVYAVIVSLRLPVRVGGRQGRELHELGSR